MFYLHYVLQKYDPVSDRGLVTCCFDNKKTDVVSIKIALLLWPCAKLS